MGQGKPVDIESSATIVFGPQIQSILYTHPTTGHMGPWYVHSCIAPLKAVCDGKRVSKNIEKSHIDVVEGLSPDWKSQAQAGILECPKRMIHREPLDRGFLQQRECLDPLGGRWIIQRPSRDPKQFIVELHARQEFEMAALVKLGRSDQIRLSTDPHAKLT